MDANKILTDIEQKVLAIGEVVGVALAHNEQVDLIGLAGELHHIYSMIGEVKNACNGDISG